MKHQACATGCLRMNELMVEMISAAEDGDKITLVKRAQSLLECSQQFVGTLMVVAGVTDDEIDKFTPNEDEDDQLLQEASSASQIRTAKVN